MLSKLKVECGYNTTNKMSRMFTDLTLSKDLMNEFSNSNQGKIINGIELKVEVLTKGYWSD